MSERAGLVDERRRSGAGLGKHIASVVLIVGGGLWTVLDALGLGAGLALYPEGRPVGDHSVPWMLFGFFALWLLPGVVAMIAGAAMVRQMYGVDRSEDARG